MSPVAPSAPSPSAPATASAPHVEGGLGSNPSEVFAEDWWSHARPILELHGYYRLRAELFHNFSLGRTESNQVAALWPQPLDNTFTDQSGTHLVNVCDPGGGVCNNRTQAGANMRFRINPELHISDNVRILSQIDLLDNLVLGSTPNGQQNSGTSSDPYSSIGALSSTQVTPTAGVNSWQNSISVKRVWGEYSTPLGELRFGRMPDQWGLGMMWNAGDGYDSDWQTTTDRIMFASGIKSLDLWVAGTWDFPNEGLTSASASSVNGGQAYDLAQLDDVNQYTAMVVRRRSPALQSADLAKGEVVWNAGARFQYRDQIIAPSSSQNALSGSSYTQNSTSPTTYVHRGMQLMTPDLWLQLLYRKFRFEAEGAMVAGHIHNLETTQGSLISGNSLNPTDTGYKFRQFGLATQTEYRAVEDRLKLQFGFGWASGDANLLPDTGRTSTLTPQSSNGGLGARAPGSRTYTEFRFHPDYRVDLILFRNILSRVQGVYYFRPSVDYDFTRTTQGQRLGGGAAVIWSRASEAVQTPGHSSDLGLELDFSLYYQSKDGALNDNPEKMGGFFTMVQYGVLFPLAGLGYMSNEQPLTGGSLDTSAAHTLRWYVGIFY